MYEAITLHSKPDAKNIQNATEKLWDAFERLKTYFPDEKKSDSAKKAISKMSNNQKPFTDLFDVEFKALTKIGNDFRIRHHETNTYDISDLRYYNYFYNRCLSLIMLASQFLE